jgi:hypothetical protein
VCERVFEWRVRAHARSTSRKETRKNLAESTDLLRRVGKKKKKKGAKTLTSLNTRSHFLFRVEENNQKNLLERGTAHTRLFMKHGQKNDQQNDVYP